MTMWIKKFSLFYIQKLPQFFILNIAFDDFRDFLIFRL